MSVTITPTVIDLTVESQNVLIDVDASTITLEISPTVAVAGGAVTSVAGRTGAVTLTTTDVGGLDEQIRDVIGTALVAGSNITLTVNDGADTITVASTASGGTNVKVQEGDVDVVTTADTLDFAAADFDVTQSPSGEANIALATTVARTSDLSGYQPLDSDLTAIAALSTTSYGRAFLALADAAAGRTALGLGTAATSATGDFDAAGAAAAAQAAAIAASQPLDSDLTAIAALSTTSFGRSLLTQADASAARSTLGLGTAATSNTTAFEAAGTVATHEADTTSVHGITDTSTLYRSGGTDVAVTDGGTGSSTAAGARTNLGLGSIAVESTTAGGDLTGTWPSPTLTSTAVKSYGAFYALGHSYTQLGGGGDSATQFPADTFGNFTHRVAARLGIPTDEVFLLGKSGAAASSPYDGSGSTIQGTGVILQHIVPGHVYSSQVTPPIVEPASANGGLYVIMQGYNDLGRSGTDSVAVAAWNAVGYNAFKHGLRVYISRPRAKELFLYNDTAIAYAGSGSWATNTRTTESTRGTTNRNSTSGGTITFTIPTHFTGGVVTFCFLANAGGYTTTTGAGSSTSLAVANRGEFPQSGNFDIYKNGAVFATVSGGHGTGAGTFTLTAAKTWASGDTITRATAGQVNWSGTATGATGSTTISGQGCAGDIIPVIKRFTGLTRADAGKTIIATSASLGSNEYCELDSIWIEDPTPPTICVLNQPYGPFALSSSTTKSKTQVDSLNTQISTVVAEFDSYVKLVDLNTQFQSWFGATLTNSIAANATSFDITVADNTNTRIGVGSIVKVDVEAMVVNSITPVSGSQYTIGVTRNYLGGPNALLTDVFNATTTGSGTASTSLALSSTSGWGSSGYITLDTTTTQRKVVQFTANSANTLTLASAETWASGAYATLAVAHSSAAPINDIRWLRVDKVHPSDYGHRLITQLTIDAIATVTQSAYAAANSGTYVAKRLPGVRSGTYYTTLGDRYAGTTNAYTQYVEVATPFYVPGLAIVTEIGYYVETANASGTGRVGRLGIRQDSGNGQPGYLLADFGQVSSDITTNGFKSITGLWQPMKPGWYWACFIAQGTSGQWSATVKTTNHKHNATTSTPPQYQIPYDTAPASAAAAHFSPVAMAYSCTATFTGAFDSQWMNPFTSGAAQTVLYGQAASGDEAPVIWMKLTAPPRD